MAPERNWQAAFSKVPPPPPPPAAPPQPEPEPAATEPAATEQPDRAAPVRADLPVAPLREARPSPVVTALLTPTAPVDPEPASARPGRPLALVADSPAAEAPRTGTQTPPAAPAAAARESRVARPEPTASSWTAEELGGKVATVLDELGLSVTLAETHACGPVALLKLATGTEADLSAQLAESLSSAVGLELDVWKIWPGVLVASAVVDTGVSERARQMALWLPKELKDRLVAAKDHYNTTYAEYIFDAFNRHVDNFPSYFPQRLRPSGGPMPVRSGRKRRGIDTPVQVFLYASSAQETLLDMAVDLSGAGSRSELVCRFLQDDLQHVADPRQRDDGALT